MVLDLFSCMDIVSNLELQFLPVIPTILEPPENLTVVQPHSATFLCNATARPRPEKHILEDGSSADGTITSD